jgi:hypothetical protein
MNYSEFSLAMTNDGISKEDWDEVIDLSAKIANAICSDDEALSNLLSTRLLRILDALERKYGRLPGILATRADCIDDSQERIALFEEAWRIANDREDRFNLVLIASSLAELHIEELKDTSSAIAGWNDWRKPWRITGTTANIRNCSAFGNW